MTVGLGSMVGIGVEAGEKCQIGALSVVPKYTKLEGGAVYAGVPVKRIDRRAVAAVRRLPNPGSDSRHDPVPHLLSIIVPVYNEERTVAAVIERLLTIHLPAVVKSSS